MEASMNTPLKTEPVAPIGKRTVQTLHGPVELPVYPPEHELIGQMFRACIRDGHGLTPSEAAKRLGISPIEIYEIFRGARTVDGGEAQRLLIAGRSA